MPAYKTTYTFEAEYLERDETGNPRKETIEIPYISSDRFFDLMQSPQIAAIQKGEIANLEFSKWLANEVMPGVLSALTPKSAMAMIAKIFESEKETFGLGEQNQPTAPDSTPIS